MPAGAFFDVDEIDDVLRFAAASGRGGQAGGGDVEVEEAQEPVSVRARARAFVVAGLRRAPLLAAHGWTAALRFGVDIEAPAHRARYHGLALVLDARGGFASGGAAIALPFHLRYQKARAVGESSGSRAMRGVTRLPPPRALIGSRCAARGEGGKDDFPMAIGFVEELREQLRGASDAAPADGAAAPVDGGICWRLVSASCRAGKFISLFTVPFRAKPC